tara:strand:+ start:1080 stop:1262 length:183 start_codon:yes stop_codon:yes gene_type:complete
MSNDTEAMHEIKAHERECGIRWTNLYRRMEEGNARFNRMEAMMWGLYALLISANLIDKFI